MYVCKYWHIFPNAFIFVTIAETCQKTSWFNTMKSSEFDKLINGNS